MAELQDGLSKAWISIVDSAAISFVLFSVSSGEAGNLGLLASQVKCSVCWR
jgi:hypothetical protein